jgi:hypothetical protein
MEGQNATVAAILISYYGFTLFRQGSSNQGGCNMDEHQNNDREAELARIKREMTTIIYGSGHRFTLDNGRVLIMTSLIQRPTYSRSIKGLPTKSYNDSKVDYGHDNETIVLHAPRLYGNLTQLLPPGSSLAKRGAEDPFELLPGVTCIARMVSKPCEPVAMIDPGTAPPVSSCLTLVWFQNYWAMPIASEVIEKLKVFDWDSHACDIGTI